MISSYFSTILFLFQNRKYNLHADILTLLIFLLNIYQQKLIQNASIISKHNKPIDC